MARFRFLDDSTWNSYTDIEGGTITAHSSTQVTYTSDKGLTVTLIGSGFVFDAAGLPLAGKISEVAIALGTHQLARYDRLKTNLDDFVTLALGVTAGGPPTAPDMTALYELLRKGEDVIFGSDYGRTYDGYAGNDTFYGGAGDDWFTGGSGNDDYYGGAGRDGVSFLYEPDYAGVTMRIERVSVGSSDSAVAYSADKAYGDDRVFDGIEMLQFSNFRDVVSIHTYSPIDSIWLLGGNDSLVFMPSNILGVERTTLTVFGGDGNDGITGATVADGGSGLDTYQFVDTIAFWSADAGGHGAVVDLGLSTGQILDDGFGNVESSPFTTSFYGTSHGDKFVGGTWADDFWSNSGNDTLAGNGGGDTLSGGNGDDSLSGGDGDDYLISGRGRDTISGGSGMDRLEFWDVEAPGHGVVVDLSLRRQVVDDGYGNRERASGIENLTGSNFDDQLTGDNGINWLWGNYGNDTMKGGEGDDDMAGEWGSDLMIGGGGHDSIGGGGDNDTMTGNGGVDAFYFAWDFVDAGVDRVTDFSAGETLWVASWWGGGFTAEDLAANQFRAGAGVTTANSSTQRFIYNTTTGDLYFDADGNGAGAPAIRFATLSNLAALSFADIHILF